MQKSLSHSNIQSFDEGIINDYRTVTGITVLNRSRFALDNIQGEVEWFDDRGGTYGKTLLSLTGSIPAGDTKTFSTAAGTLQNGTIKGNGKQIRIRFTRVSLVGVP